MTHPVKLIGKRGWLPAALALTFTMLAASAAAESAGLVSTAPENAEVYFIQPQDGEAVGPSVRVVFGLRNMGVAPAGVDVADTGHHHLLVDHVGDINYTAPLPANDHVVHFGKGQTETTVDLAPGRHRLRLLLGNYLHIPHDPPVMSHEITITVKAPK